MAVESYSLSLQVKLVGAGGSDRSTSGTSPGDLEVSQGLLTMVY